MGGASRALSALRPAQEHDPTAPRDAVAMLYDSTKCIGCKSCVVACADANGLDARHQRSTRFIKRLTT